MKSFVVASIAFASLAPRLDAQFGSSAPDRSAQAAYAALVTTSVGLLAQPIGPAMLGADDRALGWFGRFGMIGDNKTVFALAGGLDAAAGPGRFQLMIGSFSCDGCKGNVMLGGAWQQRLHSSALGGPQTRGGSPMLNVGFDAQSGLTLPTGGNGSSFALSGGVPVAIALRTGSGARFGPFLTPSLGFGRVRSGDDSDSGLRFMLDGGFSFLAPTGFGAFVGLDKVFIDHGQSTFNLGVSYTPPR
jgi:hypothetical protein